MKMITSESMLKSKGIPDGHPSIGKHVREPVVGPSWPQSHDHGGGRMITPTLEIIWGIILGVWVIYSRLCFLSPYFRDPDAARFAFGIAQRLQGVSWTDGVFYQLEKHIGYYALYELLARLFRIDIAGLHDFMIVSCAVSMIGILVLNYSLSSMIWGRRVALVSTSVLSISPMMWLTGQYPTSLVPALFFFMLAVWAMVISYRVKGGRWWLAGSAILFAFAILVRADMILGMLVPICYAFFVDRRGLRRTMILYAITAVILLVVWFGGMKFIPVDLYKIEPYQPNYPDSLLLNWWGMGPFLFVFAFSGFVNRFITDRKPLPFIFFWIVGFNTFYTGHLSDPRYFISYYPPVSWLAAFSIIGFYGWLARLVKFNRPMRVLFIILFACTGLSMLTLSIIKEGDDSVRVAWGESVSYTSDHGSFPNGAAWFYMQNFRRGKGFQYGWVEDGAERVASELLNRDSAWLMFDRAPIYIGNVSQPYVNYFALANGWNFDTMRGPFVNFQLPAEETGGSETSQPIMQTVFVSETPVPELGILNLPNRSTILMGSDAMPFILSMQGSISAPRLTIAGGWHVNYSLDGLDIYMPGPNGSANADGSIESGKELLKFFYTDPLPRWHVNLFPEDRESSLHRGEVVSHNGSISEAGSMRLLKNLTAIEWTCEILEPERWMAVAIEKTGLLPRYDLFVNGLKLENPQYLFQNQIGRVMTRWDIVLVPPEYLHQDICDFKLISPTQGDIYDIYWVQRTYSDCQFINNTAKPLNLEYSGIQCVR